MNPEKRDHNEVYKETAKLFDWGFQAVGKVNPVGELVPPRSAAPAGSTSSASPQSPGTGGAPGAKAAASAPTGSRSGGVGTALAIAGGLLVLLGGGVFLVNRRWPLPDLMRRRSRP
jgi:D-alanyl-D-alanine carboxypeptidase (penicillin-binding protein 5/6)